MSDLFISNTAVCRLIDKAFEDERGQQVNHAEVKARLKHGENQLFSVDAFVEGKKVEITLAIDMKVREQ